MAQGGFVNRQFQCNYYPKSMSHVRTRDSSRTKEIYILINIEISLLTLFQLNVDRITQQFNDSKNMYRTQKDMSRKFKAEEVRSHNEESDLWMALHGKVYDLTKFLKEHPGGEEVLISLAGKDGTTCFDDIGHSQEAKQLKDTFEIGLLEGSLDSNSGSGSGSPTGPTVDDDDWTYEEPKKETSAYVNIFIGLGVLVYAALFYYMFY